jgi:hypothetical protein
VANTAGGVIQDSVLPQIGHQLTTVVGNATFIGFQALHSIHPIARPQ